VLIAVSLALLFPIGAGAGQGLTLVHFSLIISAFCGICRVHGFPPVY
jgi:hypothetical protein